MTRLFCQLWEEAGRRVSRQSDRSTELIAAPKRFLDQVARGGGRRSGLGKMIGDALGDAICGAHGGHSGSSTGARVAARPLI
jgi:hypothetical protein